MPRAKKTSDKTSNNENYPVFKGKPFSDAYFAFYKAHPPQIERRALTPEERTAKYGYDPYAPYSRDNCPPRLWKEALLLIKQGSTDAQIEDAMLMNGEQFWLKPHIAAIIQRACIELAKEK